MLFLIFSKTKCERTGKFKGRYPPSVWLDIFMDLRKGQGREIF